MVLYKLYEVIPSPLLLPNRSLLKLSLAPVSDKENFVFIYSFIFFASNVRVILTEEYADAVRDYIY